jgi:hypothetical protein
MALLPDFTLHTLYMGVKDYFRHVGINLRMMTFNYTSIIRSMPHNIVTYSGIPVGVGVAQSI